MTMGVRATKCSRYGSTRKTLGSSYEKRENYLLARNLSLSQMSVRIHYTTTPPFRGSRFTDRDGTIDMVFTTCSSVAKSTGLGNDCYVNVAYNKQLPLCASTTTPRFRNGHRVCRAPEELCIADPNFTFDLEARPGNDVGG